MDTSFYSDKAILEYVRKNLCQDDDKLFQHYLNNSVGRFRERLSRKFTSDKQDNIEQIVYTCVTDTIRDIVLDTVGKITQTMHPYGDVIITGGEAFNMYFDKPDRIITSDIDTKFIPVFKGRSGGLISTTSPKYFGFLQSVKLRLWDTLGKLAQELNLKIKNRIEKYLCATKIGKILGISMPKKGPWVTRRYSLIKKNKQNADKNQVTIGDVLIDVELFALDLRIRYYSIEKKKIIEFNLGGILDIPIMRPHEVGYEIAFSRQSGILYKNKDTGKMIYNKHILVAGKKFLLEDVYIMQLLGLRPKKVKKDKKRLFMFATKILKIKNILKTDSIHTIFKKALPKVSDSYRISLKNRPVFKIDWTPDPLKYKRFTTVPWIDPLVMSQIVGVRASSKQMNIPGYKPSSGTYRFNLNTKRWITNNSRLYVKNEMTHRPIEPPKNIPRTRLKNILYGFNPRRDYWMPTPLIEKAAMIPIVGLKNTSFIQ